jgi:hypothetical protein
MDAADAVSALQIGDGAGDLEHAVVARAEGLRGLREERPSVGIGGGDPRTLSSSVS